MRVPVTRRDAIARKIVGPSLVRASRHDNSFGFDRQYRIHVRRLTGFDLHAGFTRLPLQPTDQTMIFAAARQTDFPIQLPTNAYGAADQGHTGPGLGGHGGRLQTCWARTDDADTLFFQSYWRPPTRLAFLPELRIINLRKRFTGVNFAPAEIIVAR